MPTSSQSHYASHQDPDGSSGNRRIQPRSFLLTGSALALTVVRWLLPAEATAEGETLWIAFLWLLAGGLFGVLRINASDRRRFDLADLSAGLLIAGHVISGCVVLAGDGNHQAALNLIWEWLSLGIFWIIWRDLLQSSRCRAALVQVMLATAVTLSVWGLWQYYVWYPQMAAKYGPIFDQIRQRESSGGDPSALLRELHDAGIPSEPGPRLLFENRLRSSREPFGPFALANTLGGLLAAWLVMGVVVRLGSPLTLALSPEAGVRGLERQPPHPNPLPRGGGGMVALWSVAGTVLFLGLMAYCLYLTNSRTAWAGAAVAGMIAGLIVLNRRIASPQVRIVLAALSAGIGVLAIAGLLWLVLRDEQLVPGPLKSLAYRAEYWQGTWRLLKTIPWPGTGPGQFRDRYLQFKLPETSEEIADPHNLVLDVWSNGGLLALAGLIGLLLWLALQIGKLVVGWQPDRAETTTDSAMVRLREMLSGWGGFAVAIAGQLLTLGYWDSQLDQIAVFSLVWLAAAWGLTNLRWLSDEAICAAGLLSGVALSIHLCGAGGIAMPAVTQLWLLLILLGRSCLGFESARTVETAQGGSSPAIRRGLQGIFAVLGLALATGCGISWWGTTQCRHFLAAGDQAAFRGSDPDRVERFYRQAAEADPLAWEPWERLAQREFSLAAVPSAPVDRTRLETAVGYEKEAIRRAPHRYRGYQQLGEFWMAVARSSRRTEDWEQAIAAYQAAEARYPTNARLLADFAVVLAADADRSMEAMTMGRRAIAQDDLNHRRGHTDRFLPEKLRERLLKLADLDQNMDAHDR